jgi:hypothetical protein
MRKFLRSLLSRHRAGVSRFNAIVAAVEAASSPEDRREHRAALLSSMGSTVIASAIQRRIDALLKSDWQPAIGE